MSSFSPMSQIAKGIVAGGLEFARTLISPRVRGGLWYSLYRYPLSMEFRKVSAPRDGQAIKNGTCVVYNAGYSAALFGLEGLPPYDTHRFANIYHHLVAANIVRPEMIYVPGPAADEDLLMVHGEEYVKSLSDPKKIAEILEVPIIGMLPGFAVEKIVSAYRYAAGGTLLAARLALDHGGLVVNLGGGFHHARPHRGGGFCLMADIPMAICKIRAERGPLSVLVVDLDVHQGDGTIACLDADESVFTLSLHQTEIFPFPKEVGDLDVIIPAGAGDVEYLRLLATHLAAVFDQSRPDIVFSVAGADVLAEDPLASVNLSIDGLVRRDRMVGEACRQRNIPLVMTLGGGYSPQAVTAQFQSIRELIAGS